jgi:hypothetical protein
VVPSTLGLLLSGCVRRHVHSGVVNTESTPIILIITPLDHFFSKHRGCKSLIPFSSLPTSCRKDFYDKVAEYFIDKGGETLSYFSAAESVPRQFGIAIASCDHSVVHQSVRSRVNGKNVMLNIMPEICDVTTAVEPHFVEVVDAVGGAQKDNGNRVGKCGRKRKAAKKTVRSPPTSSRNQPAVPAASSSVKRS